MEFIRDLWRYMAGRNKFWMLPVFLMLAVFGGLLLLSQGTAIAPFIYPLF